MSIMSAVGGYSQISALNEHSGLDTAFSIIKDLFRIEWFLTVITHLFYTIASWMMAMIDFIFILVRQLCGINTDFSSLENVVENDAIFAFFFNERVVEIMRNLVILAIVVIIVMGIIAIIKSEFDAIKDINNTGKIDNNKGEIWKRIFTSILMLFLIPMVLFGGIILSNGVLQSLYNATSGAPNSNLSSQIFIASAYDANAYRIYAKKNKKVPITYNFSQNKDYSAFTEWDSSGSVDEIASSIKELKAMPAWKQGWATFEMFYTDSFFEMNIVDYYQASDTNNAYNESYDTYEDPYTHKKTSLKTYTYEYYVNADLIDYMMQSGKKVYYLTAQEVYDSCQKASVQLDMSWGSGELANQLQFLVNYDDGENPIKYVHTKDATDELKGSVFIACVQDYYKTTEKGKEVEKTFFRPIDYAHDKFSSLYLAKENQYVVARGLFDDAKYPTAIRKNNGVVEFYREKLNIPTFSTFFPHISYELPEGVTEEVGTRVIKKIVKWVSGVNLNDFVPYIYFDIDVMHLFGKSTKVVERLSDGGYSINYVFADSNKNALLEIFSLENNEMSKTYSVIFVNYIILFVALVIILRKLLYAVVGVIKRMVDIMFLYVMYPAAVATIPLYSNSSLQKWTKNMFKKVTSMYGLILGINLGLLLVPLSGSINLITAEMLSTMKISWLSGKFGVFLFNKLIQIFFYLVGFNFIFEIPIVVQRYVEDVAVKDQEKAQKEGKNSGKYKSAVSDPVGEGQNIVGQFKKSANDVKDFVSGRKLMKDLEKAKEYIPGSAIVSDLKQKRDNMTLQGKTKQVTKQAIENLKGNVKNGGADLKNPKK